MSTVQLPNRRGPRPHTTPWAPHIQEDQNASAEMQAALAERVFALPDVEERPGTVAHPAERAIWLRDENLVMLYGPRDEDEADVIFDLIAAAVRHAGGRASSQLLEGARR